MNKLSYEELQQGCEKEQLHLSGKIQPFGALVCIDKKSGKFVYASANTDDFFGVSPEEILSKSIESSGFGIDRLIAKLPDRVGHRLILKALFLLDSDKKIYICILTVLIS